MEDWVHYIYKYALKGVNPDDHVSFIFTSPKNQGYWQRWNLFYFLGNHHNTDFVQYVVDNISATELRK